MKKLCLCLTILATLLFFAGCGGSKKENKNDEPDTGETVTDEDAVDTEPTDNPDTTPEPTDTDDPDTTPEPTDTDDPDTTPEPTSDDDAIEQFKKECAEAGGYIHGGTVTCRKDYDCDPKPKNSVWNGHDWSYIEYRDGKWHEEERVQTEYNEEEGNCHFICDEYYVWDAEEGSCIDVYVYCEKLGGEGWDYEKSICVRSNPCGERPGFSEWNTDQDDAGWCTEEYIDGSWPEEGYCDVVYSEEPGACHFVCDEGFIWLSSKSECEVISYTGLFWSEKSEEKMTIDDAVAYCENLEEDGFTDWVLPTIDELKTIVRHCSTIMPGGECQLSEYCTSTSPCAVSNNCFCTEDPTPEEGYYSEFGDSERLWSKTKTSSGKAWSMMFDVSKAGPSISTADARVRCVRHHCGDDKVLDEHTRSCVTPETRVQACNPINEFSEWNTVSNITQTWNSYTWTWEPPSTTQYYETPSENECRFKCKDNAYRDSSWKCVSNTRETECTLPENADWNGPSTVTQTWDSETRTWTPDVPEPTYSESYGTTLCGYKCAIGYRWNGSSCIAIVPLGRICTGQTSCYNASSSMMCQTNPAGTDDTYNFYGQDAQHTDKCTEQSFTASSDVIKDNNTGLVWKRSLSTDSYTWNDRETHCNELNSSNYGGKSNWRVPNPLELLTIVDNSTYNPAVNSNFTGIGLSTNLWTSKQGSESSDGFSYLFDPNDGRASYTLKTYEYKILCVSGNEMPGGVLTTQTLQDDVIVRDSTTDFMWQKEYVTGLTWQQALQYCEELTYAGYSGWRLPNKNELASLINYDTSWGTTHSDFPDMPKDKFWSSTTYASDKSRAWITSFVTGRVESESKTETYNVRCVRK